MKEWMKEALGYTVLSVFVTVVMFQLGDLPVGGVDTEYKSRLRCALHGIAPEVHLTQSPLQVGTDWVTVDLPSTLPRIPSKEYVILRVPSGPNANVDNAKMSNHKPTGSKTHDTLMENQVGFQVVVMDPQGRGVALGENYRLLRKLTGQSEYLELAYSLEQSGWMKSYYAKDAKLAGLAVRANMPVEVQLVAWSPVWYCMTQTKTWQHVSPESVYRFEDGLGPQAIPK